jgi:hypothetical protein
MAYFKQQLDATFEERPGAPSGIRGLQAILKLMEATDRYRQTQAEQERQATICMSNEELDNQMIHVLAAAWPDLLAEEHRRESLPTTLDS